jgi:hypothetical protein
MQERMKTAILQQRHIPLACDFTTLTYTEFEHVQFCNGCMQNQLIGVANQGKYHEKYLYAQSQI